MSSPWIEHVKKTAKNKGISYKEALKVASTTYKKKKTKGGSIIMNPITPILNPEDSMTPEEKKKYYAILKKVSKIAPFIPSPAISTAVKGLEYAPEFDALRSFLRNQSLF